MSFRKMSEYNKVQNPSLVRSAEYNEGLRAHMIKVYNYMSMALGVTGAAAFLTASSPAIMQAI